MNHIFEQLATTSSRNEKIQILKDNDSPLLRRIVFLALDPFTQFYIRKIPSYADVQNDIMDLDAALGLLDTLSSRRLTGNAAINFLANILGSLYEDDAKVIERIVQKDLKCGVASATVNAAFGKDFVHEYPVMLCSPMDQKTLANIEYPALAQLKADGMRFNAIVEDGKVSFRSRNGKLIELLGKLDDAFLRLGEQFGNVVFDGELLVVDNGRILSREEGNGILNKAVKGTISDEEADKVQAQIWDVIPLTIFHGLHNDSLPSKMTYGVRFDMLKAVEFPEKINLIESTMVTCLDAAQNVFEAYLVQDKEGIILKNFNAPWENKRVKHQVKFKAELTADLLCVGWEEGAGKYAGILGALNLESAGGVIKVDVGTGFTDEMRRTLTPENTIGKIVEVKYNAVISDKRTGQKSLFLPVFLNIREDKDTPDSFVD